MQTRFPFQTHTHTQTKSNTENRQRFPNGLYLFSSFAASSVLRVLQPADDEVEIVMNY